MTKRLKFVVEIDQPEGASVADVREYVLDAVSTWCGQLQPPGMGPGGFDEQEPGDPLWGVGRTVKVKRLHEPRQKPPRCAECGAPTKADEPRCEACVRAEVDALIRDHPDVLGPP